MFFGRQAKRKDNIFLIIYPARGRWLVSGIFCAAFVCPSGRVIRGFACNRSSWLRAYPAGSQLNPEKGYDVVISVFGSRANNNYGGDRSLRVSPMGIFSIACPIFLSFFFLFLFYTSLVLYYRTCVRQTASYSIYTVVVY